MHFSEVVKDIPNDDSMPIPREVIEIDISAYSGFVRGMLTYANYQPISHMCILSEIGELYGIIKKYLLHGKYTDNFNEKIIDEGGDILFYMVADGFPNVIFCNSEDVWCDGIRGSDLLINIKDRLFSLYSQEDMKITSSNFIDLLYAIAFSMHINDKNETVSFMYNARDLLSAIIKYNVNKLKNKKAASWQSPQQNP